jgi:methionyl aminopeptidase
MIVRKSAAELGLMARAGRVVARLHEAVRDAVRPGITTLELDAIAERVVRQHGAVPSFKGYRGASSVPFPATLCTSVNAEVVHGIPSPRRRLATGDLVKIDAGAILDGYHGDSAVTWIVGGEGAVDPGVAALVRHTREGLWAGLAAAQVGGRLGDVSAAIEAHALPRRYGVVRGFVGHGIGRALHEDPRVPNFGRAGRGMRLGAGLVLAVEPMFNLGRQETRTLADDWTVVTADGSLSAHWEHTVAITPDGPWVLTARDDEPAHPLLTPELVPGRLPVDVREAG